MCDCAEYVGDLCFFVLFFLVSREWIERVPPENILRVLICLRMLMRDHVFQVQSGDQFEIVQVIHSHSLGSGS